jgi:opacity protein-like surface antigen
MRKLLLANFAALATIMAGSAQAADLPIAKAPPPVPRFSWTGCYLGGHIGGGWAKKDITDPVQLVQDSPVFLGAGSTVGVTTVSPSPNGVVIGGQIGCDYQFASNFVIGVEGAASGSTMRSTRNAFLPLGNPDIALVKATTDFLPSLTARIGYAFDTVLVYARGGGALAGDKYEVSGTFIGAPYDFKGNDNRYGWIVGGGVDWAFDPHWSVNFEYDYYHFGHGNVMMFDGINTVSGVVDVRQTVQVAKVGFNFHLWGPGW